jgi:hypothetical protein
MENTIWVKSQKACCLNDSGTPDPRNPKEFFALTFSEKEVAEGISKEVPASKFFAGMVANGVLTIGRGPVKHVETAPQAVRPRTPRKVKSDE